MSTNKKAYQAKFVSQTNQTFKHDSNSKITSNNQTNSQKNQIPIPSKNSYVIKNEQKQNKVANKYNNNIIQKMPGNNNFIYENKNNKLNPFKNDNSNKNSNYSKNYNSRLNTYDKNNSREKNNIIIKENNLKNRNENGNKNGDKNRINNNIRIENDIKIKINNRNNNINKINENNFLNRISNINKVENKFKINLELTKLNLNKSYEQVKDIKYITKPKDITPRYEISKVNNDINNNSFNNKNIPNNNILIPNRNKMNRSPINRENEINNSRNKYLHNLHINKNKSFSSSLKNIQPIITIIRKTKKI